VFLFGGNLVDKDISQGVSLRPEDKTRYIEIASGVYARVDGAYIIVGSSTVSASNPMPVVNDELDIGTITGALNVIDVTHREIHEGDFYSASYKTPDGDPLADNGTLVFVLTMNSRYAHLTSLMACGGDGEIEVYEGTNIDADGTPITPQNHKRTDPTATRMTVVRDPTINADGLFLDHKFIPGGSGPFSVGAAGWHRQEWILQPTVNYMLRLTNRAGGAQPVSLSVEWYEEINN